MLTGIENTPAAQMTSRASPDRDHLLETLRRQIRKAMPRRMYSRLSSAVDSLCAIRALGFRQYTAVSRDASGKLKKFAVRSLAYPFWIRPHTSDLKEFISSVERASYGEYLPTGIVTTIVDAGANIGDTTVWYLNRFPSATVIALEPHAGNFEMLARNCAPYGERAKLVKAALWNRSQLIRICESNSHVGHRVGEQIPGQDCDAISMQDLIRNFNLTSIDILKCDIEGAEDTVLETAEDWLPSTRSMVIELHTPQSHVLMSRIAVRKAWKHHHHRNLHYYI